MSNVSEAGRPAPAETLTPTRGWLAVIAVAIGTFTVVTSEMMPVGLLTPMGASLGVTAGTAGLTLTITGLVAAVAAPAAPLVIGRADRRTVLIALMVLLAGANLLAAWAPNFTVMVVARVLIGLGMGGVWALAGALAPRLVPERSVGAATATIFSGIAVASVLGVPIGAYIQALFGWRESFVAIAGLALVVAVAMAVLLPRLPSERATRLSGVTGVLANPRVTTGLILALLLVTGHFAAYTYIRPVLEGVSGIGAGVIGTMLLVYGIAGIVGNFVAGPRAADAPRTTIVVLSAGLGTAVLLVPFFGTAALGAGALMVLWGLAYGGVSVSVQTWMMKSAPEEAESVTALFVGVFNAGIALGAFAGGQVMDSFGGVSVMWLAGALAIGALLVASGGRAPAAVER
ncbi:putative MFS family arabinose efflux permease [Nocardiopsis mwathae]|uniref:Putative MFS family arabinose efflux permease n=1 Tax=Nocardiopsis mwathae TaxID=1472723 RepID=A0A7X0D782_9ACTN|nr:MFS transporter [Nocardiopsis mwathae]MBB6174377.1 putative MFS family arabinose efflux permease [Nocardiopsis mwathae]